MSSIYTIGHSAHSFVDFAQLLTTHNIQVLVDVRSAPYSRYCPQFDREILRNGLVQAGIKYLYLGDRLGGRPSKPEHYDADGHALYSRMTQDRPFLEAIERLERGMAEFRVAIMCAEENPSHCHRRLLDSRVLIERGHTVLHIRGDGHINTEAEIVTASGKPLVNEQPALFAELDEDQWRSTASVSPRKMPETSSKH